MDCHKDKYIHVSTNKPGNPYFLVQIANIYSLTNFALFNLLGQ